MNKVNEIKRASNFFMGYTVLMSSFGGTGGVYEME